VDGLFEKKLKAALRAGLWVWGIAYGILWIQWIAYLFFVGTKPDWLQFLWGQGVSWSQIQEVWLNAMVFYKVCCWMFALVLLWLALWLREWKKLGR